MGIKAALSDIELLKDKLAEERRKSKDLRADENKICLLGDNMGCVHLPSFGGISTGILLLGVGLGLLCGCQGSRLCDCLFFCFPPRCWQCCPDRAKPKALRAPEDDQDIEITVGDPRDHSEEEDK